MIHGVLIFNASGKSRLSKFYQPSSPPARARLVQRIHRLVSARPDSECNFVDLPPGFGFLDDGSKGEGEEDLRVVYRHYATLYFVMVVDQSESELAILDLVQVFVESLDRCFENVSELDLIFHFEEVHLLLNCMITGGLVLDTNIDSIHASFAAQKKARKTSSGDTLSSTFRTIQSVSDQGWDRLGLGGAFGSRR